MTAALIAACVWVLIATVTALLPMLWQMVPGIALLASAPLLIAWIGFAHGGLWALAGLAAFLSMFRRPLLHLARRALGSDTPLPPEPGR